MIKKILIALSAIVVLLLALVFGGEAWLKGRFQKEAVIRDMEMAWNCRAHLDKTTVNLRTKPASVELHGLKLSPRDGEVGKPFAQRAALVEETALLKAERVALSMTLEDLVKRRVNVRELHLSGLSLRAEVNEEGESNLDALFESPEDAAQRLTAQNTKTQKANLVTESPATITEATPVEGLGGSELKAQKEKKKAKEPEPFRAADLNMALQVEQASVDQGQIEIMDKSSGTRTKLERVSFVLQGIDVNPADLAHHNHCGFKFEGHIQIEKPLEKLRVADFEVSGGGELEPFDPQTGIWRPDLNLAVLIKKGGLLGGAPLSAQMREKDLRKIKEFGLDLSTLAIGGVLLEDASTEIHAIGSKLIVKKDTRLAFSQYEISMLSSSWINAPEDAHITRGKLIASPELTAKLLTDAQQSLKESVGENLAALAAVAVTATLLDENQRLAIPFKSKGSLAKPEVTLDTALGGVGGALKDAGKSLLEGLLGK